MAPRRVQIAVAAVMAVLLAGLIALPFLPRAVAGSGPHSAYTASRLEERSAAARHARLLVPTQLPAAAQASEDATFDLLNVIHARPGWVSDYVGFGTLFRVYQRRTPEQSEPCGLHRNHGERIEREVDGFHMTVCVTRFTPDARAYWNTVAWTSDYGSVTWLVPGE